MGDDYTIADISMLGWVRNLVGFYGARDLVSFDTLERVPAWLERCLARPAVQRGLEILSWPGWTTPLVKRARPQPQRVADDADRGQRHRRGGDHRRQHNSKERIERARGDRHARGVVDEGEEQVLADIGHGRLRQAPRPHDAHQIAFDQSDISAFDRHIRPRSHGDADIRGGERGRIVDAVARHRDHPALALELFDQRALVLGQDLRLDIFNAETARDSLGGGAIVAGEHDDANSRGA